MNLDKQEQKSIVESGFKFTEPMNIPFDCSFKYKTFEDLLNEVEGATDE